jgi:hypothetical protein
VAQDTPVLRHFVFHREKALLKLEPFPENSDLRVSQPSRLTSGTLVLRDLQLFSYFVVGQPP